MCVHTFETHTHTLKKTTYRELLVLKYLPYRVKVSV